MCSAISSISSSSYVFSCHLSLSQISTLLKTPTKTTSFVRFAYSLKTGGRRILPCLSSSQEAAPAKKKRENFLASLEVMEMFLNFSSMLCHSSDVYTNKHPSSPFVTTNSSPSCSLNFAGTISLPFGSTVWLYSPINMTQSPAFVRQLVPLDFPFLWSFATTSNHSLPLSTTFKHILDYS